MNKTIHSTEVVVVGGGAVGLSIAYWLDKRGMAVTVVDKNAPGTGTSVANFGLVCSVHKEPYTYMELNLRSCLLWPQMIEELGEDVDYRRGFLKVALTGPDYAKLEAVAERQKRSLLFGGRMLSAREVWEIQPGISRDIAGALYSPYDGASSPIKWTYALLRACKRRGVTLMKDTEVSGFDLGEENQITGVRTTRGRIRAEYAVNAAGIWADRIARMVGVTMGLFPERGQILVSEPAPTLLPLSQSLVRQVPEGNVLMGATMEDAGCDWGTTIQGGAKIARNAVRMVPRVCELSVIRQFSGLRPMPRDGQPFLGPIPHVPGFYVAVSHSGHTLSAIYGKIISDLIVDGHTDIAIGEYDPLRYDERTMGSRVLQEVGGSQESRH